MTAKHTGASCPSCDDPWPAEYAQINQSPRWTCHVCGAGGDLFGKFDGRKSKTEAAAPAPTKQYRPWMKGAPSP